MLRRMSGTLKLDEVDPCKPEQNVSFNDQKVNGVWCKWKSRPSKRQLEAEVQTLKAMNADQVKEFQTEVQTLKAMNADQVKELQAEIQTLKAPFTDQVKGLQAEVQTLKALNADQAKEIKGLRAELEDAQSLRGERLNAIITLKDQLEELQRENEYLVFTDNKYSLKTASIGRRAARTRCALEMPTCS